MDGWSNAGGRIMRGNGFEQDGTALVGRIRGETIRLEPVGQTSVRVRTTRNAGFDNALPSGLTTDIAGEGAIEIGDDLATLTHGTLKAELRRMPRGLGPTLELTFRDTATGEILLQEEMQHILYPNARNYRAEEGALWRIETCFTAHEGERFYGLGQHQHGRLDQKGCVIDLLQMNTEVVIPFLISSRGYGLIWNNPGIGRVELAENRTRWILDAAPQLDYVVMPGNPAALLKEYAALTGHPPMMPDWAMGFWQCKLRYRTQDQVLSIARAYKERGLPISCLVIDFFNWTRGGEGRMNPDDFPDPAAMVAELQEMGIRPMISIWPTVNANAENHNEMRDAGYLIQHRRGVQASSIFLDAGSEGVNPLSFYDATNPDARAYHWSRIREGYARHGFGAFWLDANEPEVYPTHPDNMLYHAGDGRAVTNAYPLLHQQGYAEHMEADGIEDPILLSRSAWLGTQRYPVVVWSGDVHSTFADFARQIRAGLNMALSGIPWWTTDIGGFKGGDIRDPGFAELMIRWFQYGTFCPVMRLHGFRMDAEGDPRLGRDFLFGGADNEVWSFGEEVYGILAAYMHLRERLRPYITSLMQTAHQTGLPPMRPLLVDFAEDPRACEIEDQFLFGPDLLVAPILEAGATAREVYLPEGARWTCAWTGAELGAGQTHNVSAPLDRIPLFLRDGAMLPIADPSAEGPI